MDENYPGTTSDRRSLSEPLQGRQGAPAPRQGSGVFKGCLVAVVVLGALSVFALLGLLVLLFVGALMTAPAGQDDLRLEESTVGGTPGAAKVVCIPVEGVIYGVAGLGGLTPVSLVGAQLRRAQIDPSVCGVILYVDSPGGDITGSDVLYRQVRRFSEDPGGRPVVVCMLDMATSGAYYASVAADRIIAHPTTITGSIGVMMPLYDVTDLMEKAGVRDESLTTGPLKDIASPFVRKTPEQRQKEREILQGIIDEMHERFVTVVAEGRRLELNQVRPLADGRIFTSTQALEHGLIDQIGYESDAVEAVKELASVAEVHLVRYRRVISLSDVLAAFAQGPRVSVSVETPISWQRLARPQFLWIPPTEGGDQPPR